MPSSTKTPQKTLIALSGFLGRRTDWSLVENFLPSGWQLHAIDLWTENLFANYDEWASAFTSQIEKEVAGPRVLLGYSMGGRLALHALVKRPDLFSGGVIVSVNPGLMTEEERALRRQTDEVWATKFLREPWDSIIQEWNSQAALRAPKSPTREAIELVRRESDFDRRSLAQVLRTWSLGLQRNLRPEVDALTLPIQFVTGQDDVKFTAITRDWMKDQACGEREHAVVPDAGHRVPWDAPVQLRAILAKFLSRW